MKKFSNVIAETELHLRPLFKIASATNSPDFSLQQHNQHISQSVSHGSGISSSLVFHLSSYFLRILLPLTKWGKSEHLAHVKSEFYKNTSYKFFSSVVWFPALVFMDAFWISFSLAYFWNWKTSASSLPCMNHQKDKGRKWLLSASCIGKEHSDNCSRFPQQRAHGSHRVRAPSRCSQEEGSLEKWNTRRCRHPFQPL